MSFALAQPSSNLSQADRQTWFELLNWPAEYESYYQASGLADDPDNAYLRFYPLKEHYLVEIITSLGAYQPSFIYMLYEPASQEATLLEFPDYSLNAKNELEFHTQVELVGLASFNRSSQELSIFSKWRGVGGCGSLTSYSFETLEPQLLSIRAQTCEAADEAGENMILEPSSWPLIYSLEK